MKYEKIKELPDDYKAPIRSRRHQDDKKVLIEGPQGVFFGWEAADGTLHPGALIEQSEERQSEDREFRLKAEKNRAKLRQEKVIIDNLREKRASGELLTQEEIQDLADILLSKL